MTSNKAIVTEEKNLIREEIVGKELCLTENEEQELRHAINNLEISDIQLNTNEKVLPSHIQKCIQEKFLEIVNGDNENSLKIREVVPVGFFIDEFEKLLPDVYSDRIVDGVKAAVKATGHSLFSSRKPLDNTQIEEFRSFLMQKNSENINNNRIAKLCVRMLENPYLLDQSTFYNWLNLLAANSGDGLIHDFNTILSYLEEKSLSETTIEQILKKKGQRKKRNLLEKFHLKKKYKENTHETNSLEVGESEHVVESSPVLDFIENWKKKDRIGYYKKVCAELNEIRKDKSRQPQVIGDLSDLQSLVEKLINSGVGHAPQDVENFLLAIFDPEIFNIQTKKMTPLERDNCLSKIFDLGMKYLQDRDMKEKFAEALFAYDLKLAVIKGYSILKEREKDSENKVVQAYPLEFKKFVIEKMTDCYRNKEEIEIEKSKLDDIKTGIKDFIIETDNSDLKTTAFNFLKEAVADDEKESLYLKLLDDKNTFMLPSLHKEILGSKYFSDTIKRTDIVTLSRLFNNNDEENDDKVKNKVNYIIPIFEVLANAVLNLDNSIEIRQEISEGFYKKIQDEDRKDIFLRTIHSALKEKNESTVKLDLPNTIKEDLDKAKSLSEYDKKELKEQILRDFLLKKNNSEDTSKEVNELISYIIPQDKESDNYTQRRDLLREILELVKE